jgi:hypothetical protein
MIESGVFRIGASPLDLAKQCKHKDYNICPVFGHNPISNECAGECCGVHRLFNHKWIVYCPRCGKKG